jgi:hypothetical protein
MKILILILLTCAIYMSCSKSTPNTTATVPPTDTTVTNPPQPAPSLSNPIPLDTLGDWIRIGRVAYTLYDIWFTSGTVGFITNDSSLFKTVDNGITWQKIPNTS